MLLDAEVGVAAWGSIPTVMSLVDDRLPQPGGAGVGVYIRNLLEHGGGRADSCSSHRPARQELGRTAGYTSHFRYQRCRQR